VRSEIVDIYGIIIVNGTKNNKKQQRAENISDGFGMAETWGESSSGSQDKVRPCALCSASISSDVIFHNLLCTGCALFVPSRGLNEVLCL